MQACRYDNWQINYPAAVDYTIELRDPVDFIDGSVFDEWFL